MKTTYNWIGGGPFVFFIIMKNLGAIPYSWWWLLVFLPLVYVKRR